MPSLQKKIAMLGINIVTRVDIEVLRENAMFINIF